MSKHDDLHVALTSDPAELPRVREALRAWTGQHGWEEEQIGSIVLAVDEALSNVIRHGYGGQPGHRIEIGVRALHDPTLGPGMEIRIRDFGKQVSLAKIRGRDLDDHRPGGLGVHIIRNVMTSVEYSHAAGGGMQVVMRKYQRPTMNAQSSQAEDP